MGITEKNIEDINNLVPLKKVQVTKITKLLEEIEKNKEKDDSSNKCRSNS